MSCVDQLALMHLEKTTSHHSHTRMCGKAGFCWKMQRKWELHKIANETGTKGFPAEISGKGKPGWENSAVFHPLRVLPCARCIQLCNI